MEANDGGPKRKAHSSTDQSQKDFENKLRTVMSNDANISYAPKKKKQKRFINVIKGGITRRVLFPPAPETQNTVMTIVREKPHRQDGGYQRIDWQQVQVTPGTPLGNGWYIGDKRIGSGGNGIVLSAKNDSKGIDNKWEYVVKIITEEVGEEEATMLYNVSLKGIPGIPQLIQRGLFCNGDIEDFHYIIMTKPIHCMNLREYSTEQTNMNDITSIFRDLTNVVKKIIENGFVQTDLTPTNVIVDRETLKVYVIDFGSVCIVNDFEKEFLGTYLYRPPEILHPSERSPHFDVIKATVWMLGCILYELLFNGHYRMEAYLSRANQGMSEGRDCENYKNFHFSPQMKDEVSEFPDYVAHVLKGCLCIDHAKRMTIDDILETKWLTQGTTSR